MAPLPAAFAHDQKSLQFNQSHEPNLSTRHRDARGSYQEAIDPDVIRSGRVDRILRQAIPSNDDLHHHIVAGGEQRNYVKHVFRFRRQIMALEAGSEKVTVTLSSNLKMSSSLRSHPDDVKVVSETKVHHPCSHILQTSHFDQWASTFLDTSILEKERVQQDGLLI